MRLFAYLAVHSKIVKRRVRMLDEIREAQLARLRALQRLRPLHRILMAALLSRNIRNTPTNRNNAALVVRGGKTSSSNPLSSRCIGQIRPNPAHFERRRLPIREPCELAKEPGPVLLEDPVRPFHRLAVPFGHAGQAVEGVVAVEQDALFVVFEHAHFDHLHHLAQVGQPAGGIVAVGEGVF